MSEVRAFETVLASAHASAVSGLTDFNTLFGFHSVGAFLRRDCKNTLVVARLNLALVDTVRQLHGTHEASVAAFHQKVIFILLLLAVPLLTFEREDTVLDGQGHVLFVDAGQLGFDDNRLSDVFEVEHG